MVFRYAIKNDLKKIYTLICELEKSILNFEDFNRAYIDNLQDKNIYYMVAEDEEKEIVGFISLHIQKLLHHVGNIGEIQELIVLDKARRVGIGKELLKQAKKLAIEKGCIQLEVCCNTKREESHLFYISQKLKKTHYKFTYDLQST